MDRDRFDQLAPPFAVARSQKAQVRHFAG